LRFEPDAVAATLTANAARMPDAIDIAANARCAQISESRIVSRAAGVRSAQAAIARTTLAPIPRNV